MSSLRVLWVLLLVASAGRAEPTPQPSVEPTTPAATTTPAPPTTSSDLKEESQDQVAILKQINRVNDDGSYTFGYEAADGSFKIETRDVAGNVKGMFGFVDDGGELKRISYTASNGTGYQTTGSPNIPPLISHDGESTTRISLLPGATTEKPGSPIYIYKVTTRAPRPEVIQHIPKLRPTPATLSTAPTESGEVTDTNLRRPTYGAVLPKKSPTPNYITLGSSTQIPEDDDVTRRPSFVQTVRPRGYKKILVTKRPVEVTTVTTQGYSTTFTTDLSQEMMETGDDLERQVESNSLADSGLLTSGTEDSPDVYGVNPTARPYPADAYQTLFSPLPQYQRILQGQLVGGGAARLASTEEDSNSSKSLDQATQSQSLVPGRSLPGQEALPQDPRLGDPRLSQDPRLGLQDPRLPSLRGLQDPRLGGQDPRAGLQDPRLGLQDPRLSGLGNQDPRLSGFQDTRFSGAGGQDPRTAFQDPRLSGQDPRLPSLAGLQDPRLSGLGPQDPRLSGLQDPRLSGLGGQDPRLAGGFQDPRLFGRGGLQDPGTQDPRLQDPRLNPRGQDPRLDPSLQDPRLSGYGNGGSDPRLTGGLQDPRQQQEDPRLYGLNGGGLPDPRLRGDPRLEGLPIPGTQGKVLPLPQDGSSTQRPYQGLVFPSGPGRQPLLPPPGAPSPLDYSTTARSLPSGNVGDRPYPPPPRRPLGRRPQVLPPATYNPEQGLNEPDEPALRQPQYPDNRGGQNAFLMEQLLRMLIANQARQQPGLPPFQQALLSTIGGNNVPPELLRSQNYGPRNLPFDPRTQNFDPRFDPRNPMGSYDTRNAYYDPRNLNYDQRNFDPRFQRYGPYQRDPYGPYGPPPQPYGPQPYDPRYPYPDQAPYPRQNDYPYQGYSPYGVTPNPYYQMTPEELLLRMFLGPRFPSPIPQNEPQIQNSPYDNAAYSPRQQALSDYEQSDPGSIFGQRVPQENNIVQRSPLPPTREVLSRSPIYRQRAEPSQRSTTIAPKEETTTRNRQSFVQRVLPSQRLRIKGSRNVQIIDDTTASASTTTAKP